MRITNVLGVLLSRRVCARLLFILSTILLSSQALSAAKIKVDKAIIDGGYVDFGATATFEITVTNVGDVKLDNVLVSDAKSPDCGGYLQSRGGPNELQPGDYFQYTCVALNVQSDFVNTASVSGQYKNRSQCISGSTAGYSDEITIIVKNRPSIDIRKQQEGPDSRTIPTGTDVDFDIEVTNNGGLPLTDVVVSDPKVRDCDALIESLGLGESENYTCIEPNVQKRFTNTATANGRAFLVGGNENGCLVSDSDRSTVNVEDLHCAVSVTKYANPDTIVRMPMPDCDSIGGRPEVIQFRYTGGGCAASNNDQGDKATCVGSLDDSLTASVDPNDSDLTVNGSPVTPEGTFTVSGDFPSNAEIILSNTGGIETNEYHASCSQPLAVGDVFGSLTVIGLDGQTATDNEVLYTYNVTNIGDDAQITLTDDLLGPIPETGQNVFDLLKDQTQSFEVATTILETTTNIVTASASLHGDPGIVCMSMASATVTVVDAPKSCDDGKPTSLVFEYTGASCDATSNDQEGKAECSGNPAGAAPVEIVMTNDEDKISVTPEDETLVLNGLVTISRLDGDSFSSETEFDIRQGGVTLQSLNVHTSCSKELNVGDQFGSMILREFIPE